MIYRVKAWNDHFENSKSRERDQCSFVCVPNKQHGMGFSRLMAEKDGATIYGIWHLIIGACSQQKKPREGWLTSDGHQTGTAWAPEDLSMKFRRPEKEIERALEVLSSVKIGWIEVYADENMECPPTTRQLPAECPLGIVKEEKERREEKRKNIDPSINEVLEFCKEAGLPDSDAEYFFNKCVGNGWTNAGRPIKDWKATIRSWKSAGYLPSQKLAKPVAPNRDGPTLSQVNEYAREKWGNEPCGNWAASFFGYWADSKRNWRKKDGRLIDWKIEFGNQVAKWRTAQETEKR